MKKPKVHRLYVRPSFLSGLIAFAGRLQQVTGQVFAIFVITVAAAEAAVGLGIVIAMFKNKETMNINEIDLMKW